MEYEPELGNRARAIELALAALAVFKQIKSPHMDMVDTDMVRRQLANWQGERRESHIEKNTKKQWWEFWK